VNRILNEKYAAAKHICRLVQTNVGETQGLLKSLKPIYNKLNIPMLAQLRDTQNYNRETRAGLGIHEINHQAVEGDKKHWQSIFSWIETNAKNKSILENVRKLSEAAQSTYTLRDVS